jgi:radical SAM protein with 4Fe4S-binding SPASM domain
MGRTACGNEMILYLDREYRFFELFSPNNGFLARSNAFGLHNAQPTQRSYPELIDIGIMGNCHAAKYGICKNAGIDCYQSAILNPKPNMDLLFYKKIISESRGKVFQVALGGAGDPNKHMDFADILKFTRNNYIIPNYTTSGLQLTDDEIMLTERYCGAVAVSFYSRLVGYEGGQLRESNTQTINAINRLVQAGCIVNVHYVLSKNTIKEAIYRIENNLFPNGIHAVIFLLYKAIGLGSLEKVLTYDSDDLFTLINLVQKSNTKMKFGFDTCCTPAILLHNSGVTESSIEFCDAARFSMYIDCSGDAYPCSFAKTETKYTTSIVNSRIKDAWQSEPFQLFRAQQSKACVECRVYNQCLGGCALGAVNLCKK